MTCPIDAFFKIIGQRWNAYILWQFESKGNMRFGEVRKAIPEVSQKVLTEKLRNLENHKLIWRRVYATTPPSVEYGLTELGLELRHTLCDLASIAEDWRKRGIV